MNKTTAILIPTIGSLLLASMAHAVVTTIPATGWNQDTVWAVSEPNSGAPNTTAPVDTGNQVFYQVGVPGSPGGGLPTSRTFVSAANASVTFNLQPYNAVNDLRLASGSGTLTFVTSGKYSTINVLDTGGAGASTFSLRFNFADATFTNVTGKVAPDWFGGSPFAIAGIGRISQGNPGTFDGGAIGGNNPRMYELDVPLAFSDSIKVLNSIQFTQTSGGVLNVFALSGTLTQVPEPSTILLIGIGGFGLAGIARRKRNR